MERTVHLIRGTFGSMMNTHKVHLRGAKIITPSLVVYCLALRNEVQTEQIANPTALTLISAFHFGQNFSPPGRSAASGNHRAPMATDSNTTGSNMEGYR